MRLDRLKAMSRPEHRMALVMTSAALALVLILGGIAFASQGGSGSRQAASGNGAGSVGNPNYAKNAISGSTSTQVPNSNSSASSLPGTIPSVPTTVLPNGQAVPLTTAPGSIGTTTTPPTGGWANKTQNGLSLTVKPSSPDVPAGSLVTFSSLVQDPSGVLKSMNWDFGDGQSTTTGPSTCNASEGSSAPAQTNFPMQVSHAYRSPGQYTVKVSASTSDSCNDKNPSETVTTVGAVNVDAAAAPSNGPQPPAVSLTPNPNGTMPEDPHVSVLAKMNDGDGYISRVVTDWNDGTAPSVLTYPLSDCKDPQSTWPSSNRSESLEHIYAAPGTYNVSVTVTSTGCDGENAQQAIGVASVTAGSSPVPTTNP